MTGEKAEIKFLPVRYTLLSEGQPFFAIRFVMIAKLITNSETNKILTLLALTLPAVCCGLCWTAINFPIASKDRSFVVRRENDTTFRVIKRFFAERGYPWTTDREVHYLLDYQAGTIRPVSAKTENSSLTPLCDSISGSQSSIARISFEDLKNSSNQLGIAREPMLTSDYQLVVLFNPENVEISRWQIPAHTFIDSSRGLIATLDPLGIKLIVRDAATGETLWSMVVEEIFNSKTFGWIYVYDSVVCIDHSDEDVRFYELHSGRRLLIDGDNYGQIFDVAGNEYLTAKVPVNHSAIPVLQLRESPDGQVLREFLFPKNCWNPAPNDDRIRFSPSKQEIIFVSSDDAVNIVDKATGNVVEVVAPRKMHLYWAAISILGAIAWGWTFNLFCDRVGCRGFVRNAVLSFIVFSFLFARTQLSGHPQNYDRLAWQSIGALIFTLTWGIAKLSCNRNASILNRIQLPLAFGLTIFLALVFSNNSKQLFQPVVLVMMGLAAQIAIFLYFSPLKNSSSCQRDDHVLGFRFTIADTLKLATFVALLIVAFKHRNIHYVLDISFVPFPKNFLLSAMLTLATFVAWYVASRRNLSWLLRVVIALAICFAIPGLIFVWAVLYEPAQVINSKLLIEDQWILLSAISFTVVGTLTAHSPPKATK